MDARTSPPGWLPDPGFVGGLAAMGAAWMAIFRAGPPQGVEIDRAMMLADLEWFRFVKTLGNVERHAYFDHEIRRFTLWGNRVIPPIRELAQRWGVSYRQANDIVHEFRARHVEMESAS